MTNNDDLALELREAAESATKGSWRRTSTEFNGICVGPFSFTKEQVLARAVEKRDAIFISVANPENILSLLAERDADKKRIEMLEKYVNERDAQNQDLLLNIGSLQQRIAELEDLATDYGMKFQRAQDDLKHMALMHRGEVLKEKRLPEPYAYLRENDGQIQISIGSERPSDRSGGYATPWFAIYTAAGINLEAGE